MKVLLITANPKRKGALATLTSEATRGLTDSGIEVEEIRLADCDIGYCNFCFKCVRDPESAIGPCSQNDDMRWILEKAKAADGFVMATQLSSGHANARFKTFVERATYTAGRDSTVLFVKGFPRSRFTDKRRYAITLATAGGMPSWLRVFCNTATKQMVELSHLAFNARVVGKLYAGMIRSGMRKRDPLRAYQLGQKLASQLNAK